MQKFTSKTLLRREMPMMFLFRLMVRGDIVMVHLPLDFQIVLFNLLDSSAVILKFHMATVGATGLQYTFVLTLNPPSSVAGPMSVLRLLLTGTFSSY